MKKLIHLLHTYTRIQVEANRELQGVGVSHERLEIGEANRINHRRPICLVVPRTATRTAVVHATGDVVQRVWIRPLRCAAVALLESIIHANRDVPDVDERRVDAIHGSRLVHDRSHHRSHGGIVVVLRKKVPRPPEKDICLLIN